MPLSDLGHNFPKKKPLPGMGTVCVKQVTNHDILSNPVAQPVVGSEASYHMICDRLYKQKIPIPGKTHCSE